MITEIKKMLEKKVKELGNNFDPSQVWEKEMIIIQETEWDYFPEFECTYYSESQREGLLTFNIRFSQDNQYLNYVKLDSDIHVILK